MKCPNVEVITKQHKTGKIESGSQRYGCYLYKNKYTPEKKPHSYDDAIRKKAVQMYVDGISLREK